MNRMPWDKRRGRSCPAWTMAELGRLVRMARLRMTIEEIAVNLPRHTLHAVKDRINYLRLPARTARRERRLQLALAVHEYFMDRERRLGF